MSTKTTNFEFIKPEKTDPADITATNENWDKLDEALIKRDEDLSMGGHKITNVAEPESGSDVATRNFVERHSIAGNTYVAVDYDKDGNVTLKPYVADEDELVFRDHINNEENPHNVTAEQIGAFGEHNKPYGTYIGTGNSRSIPINGIGKVLYIWSNQGTCHVTSLGWSGITAKTSNSGAATDGNTAYFADNYLRIVISNSTDERVNFFNRANHTYYYQLL